MKYISFYDTQKDRRGMCVAAVNKINYIAGALNRIGVKVEIISASMIAYNKIDKCTEKLTQDTDICYFKTNKTSKNKLKRIYNVFRQSIILFFYLLKNVKRDEEIIVYHSLGLMRSVYLAKKIKKFKMILETEEIYTDVVSKTKKTVNMERKFIDCADKYIFPTELLNKKLNTEGKPYAIIHGTYQTEEKYDETFNDDKIHVVYAGTFNPKKGGALAALAAEYLSSDYQVHILGFGNQKEKENIERIVEEVNNKTPDKLKFEGLLIGEDYIKFLQKCHIGLSPQNPDAEFNGTSFPSKILSYMSNGLRVVSIKIPAIYESKIGNDIYYYDKQAPEEISKAIMNINLNDSYNGRERVRKLDEEFCQDLKGLLEV